MMTVKTINSPMLSNMSKLTSPHELRTTLRKKDRLATGDRELTFPDGS